MLVVTGLSGLVAQIHVEQTLGFRLVDLLGHVLTVHDSLVFYVAEEKVQEAGVLIKGLMERQPFPEFDVPLVAEVATGPNYGELDEW